MRIRDAWLVLALSLACGPVPGGSLRGQVAEPPPDWRDVLADGHGFCEIESRPDDPHSIQLDCFIYGGTLYVQSHRFALASWWPVDSWAAIWIEHPDVKVRIGDSIYELRAKRVADAAERDGILRLRGYDPPPDGIVLFRLERRT